MKQRNYLSSKLLQIGGFALCTISVALCAFSGTTAASGAVNGEQIFKDNCAGCHAGGGNVVDPKKPLKGSSKLGSQDSFKAYLLKPSGVMPPFPQIANDAASLEGLYKYCKSLK